MKEIEKWLEDRIILKVYKGSHAYGTNHINSDMDIGGVCIPPKQYLYGGLSFDQYESKNYTNYPSYKKSGLPADAVIFGLHKFVRLAIECNPNVIETLFTDRAHILQCNIMGRMLLDQRQLFLTRRARHTFGGYAFNQLRRLTNKQPLEETRHRLSKLEQTENNLKIHAVRVEHRIARLFQQEQLNQEDIKEILNLRHEYGEVKTKLAAAEEEHAEIDRIMGRGNHNHHGSHSGLIERYGYDVKHAMHLIRLLLMGLEILTEGECRVLRPDNNYLMAIRYGEYSLEQIQQESEKLFSLMDEAYVKSSLPDMPDSERINQMLMEIFELSFEDRSWQS